MTNRLVIAGARNSEILRLVASSRSPNGGRWDLIGFADDSDTFFGREVLGVPVFARFSELGAEGPYADCLVANNIGSEPAKRKAAAERLDSLGVRWATLIHDTVETDRAMIGEGSLVHRDVIISAGASVGIHSYLNFRAQVTHDCRVGDYCILAPAAMLMARVQVGSRVFVGPGAVVIADRVVGDDAVVGGLALVTADVAPGTTVVGNPARGIFRRPPQ